jgi:tetratricopeptide (TPR) repeat protein
MKTVLSTCCAWLCLFAPAIAQAKDTPTPKPGKAAEASAEKPARAKVSVSDAGRAALAAAKETAGRAKGLTGPERLAAVAAGASAYDKVVADFAAEPSVAGAAAFAAAELWRQHGSLPLAEKDYLLAAEVDGPRFGQRGLLGAADMQRRLKRNDEAMATYQKAAAVEPGGARAQEARLWQARLLQSTGRLDEAIASFQSALESASPGRQSIEAANHLALACIAKADLEAAERAIDHAEQSVRGLGEDDPIVVQRLEKALETMSAKKALQRARDRANRVGKDAVELDTRKNSGG